MKVDWSEDFDWVRDQWYKASDWAKLWKQRAHLDNMRAFQWRKLANKRLELLRRVYEEDCYPCLFCGNGKDAGHADDCELAKELADD